MLSTIEYVNGKRFGCIAEIGIEDGNTSERLAACLTPGGTLHLFDFDSRVARVVDRLRRSGHTAVIGHPNSNKAQDNYNWSLMRMLQKNTKPIFDYVYLDGAHTWQIDALCFFLVDRLLKVGGYFDFDDYNWSMDRSPTVNPRICPKTSRDFTDEQILECHISLIVDLLVRTNPRYVEVVQNKIFRKVA